MMASSLEMTLRTDVGVARMPLPLNGLGLSSLDQNLQPFAVNNEVSKWVKDSWNEQNNKTTGQANRPVPTKAIRFLCSLGESLLRICFKICAKY